MSASVSSNWLKHGFATVFALILALLAAETIQLSPAARIHSPSDEREALGRTIGAQIDASAFITATTEPVTAQVTVSVDGPSLLNAYCVQCHTIRSLEEIKKSYPGWENILVKMEAFGVHLKDGEKVILLDYLAGVDPP